MADDEQFSLCWNNFNSNLSAGFHESLCRGDLVDVTLAAEGQFVKAHRLVLSVCSPYFRKMFTQMPANQHAFVFLKDVSHTALKDLIQFMYCGEVNVKQEALPAFISTAEALQIKGLTDGDPPQPQSPAEPAAPVTQVQQQLSSPRVRQQRTSTTRSYKIETVEDSDDNKQTTTQIVIAPAPQQTQTITTHHPAQQTAATTTTVVSQKRPAQRSIGSAHVKRTKSTIDPLEGADVTPTTQQITVQTAVVATSPAETKIIQHAQSETEYIDLPIELPTKSEPDYSEDVGGDVDGNDQDTAYVEDDSYGEMRYDDTYFTENEDGGTVSTGTGNVGGGATTSKAIVKQQQGSFTDSSYVDASDQTNNDAQVNKQKRQRQSVAVTGEPTIVRKRGRPKTQHDQPPPEKILDKIKTAIEANRNSGTILFASTTKGAMKLIYEGHHFRYSFRTGQYSIFQCCYKENKEECKARVVSNQKRVYPLDGEHTHFVQATDKSATSIILEPAQIDDVATAQEVEQQQGQDQINNVLLNAILGFNDTDIDFEVTFEEASAKTDKNVKDKLVAKKETGKTTPNKILNLGMNQPAVADNVSTITIVSDEVLQDTEKSDDIINKSLMKVNTPDADDFREKIKKRLQKALMGKKK